MPEKKLLQRLALTQPKHLQTLVENRRIFNLKNCELNIFESYQETYQVPLTFNDFVITSMIRGKKIMHLRDKPAFEYLPGETVIAPANETMVIDFPEATIENPTQCIALSVDAGYIENTVDYLNSYYTTGQDHDTQWKLRYNQYHFDNDNEVSDLINKLIRICGSGDKGKSIYADLSLKELLIRLLQSQQLLEIGAESGKEDNRSRLHFVLHYIHEHLTSKISVDELSRKAYLSRNSFFKWFREQAGISPLEYINHERIKLSKQLLTDPANNLYMVSERCGFSDVNYFIRVFKKAEGITPKVYQSCTRE